MSKTPSLLARISAACLLCSVAGPNAASSQTADRAAAPGESGPRFSFRSPATETGAARTPRRGWFGAASPLLPIGANPYGYAYHFGNGDPSVNATAAYWLWSESRRGSASNPSSNPNRAAPNPTPRFASNPGGSAARRFNANPYAAGSQVARRFNNYGGRFSTARSRP